MTLRRDVALLLAAGGLFAAAAASAHPEHADTMANAKVLDPATPKEEVMALMNHMSEALGVRCSTCHVGEEGAPLSTYDFASDAKPEKAQARMMLRLTHMINASENLPGEDFASWTDMERNRVNCATCHQGQRRPPRELPASE